MGDKYIKDPDYDKHAAIIQEEAAKLDEFADERRKTYKALFDNLPDSIASLKQLQWHGGKDDGVRLKAAQILLELAEIGPRPTAQPANQVVELKVTSGQAEKISEAEKLMGED